MPSGLCVRGRGNGESGVAGIARVRESARREDSEVAFRRTVIECGRPREVGAAQTRAESALWQTGQAMKIHTPDRTPEIR